MTASRKRICFASVSSGVWGAERSMVTLARALRSTGAEPVLVCLSAELAQFWAAEVGTTATVVSVDSRRAHKRTHLNARIWSAIADTDEVAAVVIFSYVLAAGAPVYRIRRRSAQRGILVLDLHDNLEGPRGRLLLRATARAFDAVISVSQHTDAQLETLKVPRTVIYRPVSSPPHVLPTANAAVCRVGVVGRLVPQKKIDLAIEAIASLDERYCLVIRGEAADGGDAKFSSDLIARAVDTLGERLQFDGPIEWSAVFQGLDVLLVCNDDEPMGRTVAEAQLAGLVAVVPSKGGSSELVEDTVTGFTYAASNASALASALVQASERGAPHDALILAARAAAEDRHDVVRYAVNYLDAMGLAPLSLSD